MSLRTPLAANARRQRIADGFSLPPPIGGLNARDALSNMDPEDALILENYFPEPTFVEMRRGTSEYADTATGIALDTIMQWAGPMSNKLFTSTPTNIYDVTAGGASASVVAGQTNGRYQFTMFTTSGGAFLVLCNGSDPVLNFDGTTWTTPAITVGTSSTFIYVVSHKERLWFVQKNTTDAWYMPTLSIAGAAAKFPLGAVFQLGGYLVAIESLSQDSGNGQDDYLCFFSSNGEVAVYQGTDPSDPDLWALVGRFALARPVPLRPALKVGGDIALITDDGVISVMKSLNMDKAALAKAAITNKIATLFNGYVAAYRGNFGWQAFTYPRGNWAIFNIPVTENTTQIQFVMNTLTGAWCSFNSMNANCWGVMGEDLYFAGNDGKVYLADTGYQDGTAAILGRIKTAFNYLGNRGTNKYPTLARPVYQSNGRPSIQFGIDVDFSNNDPGSTLDIPTSTVGWDIGLWDAAVWASGDLDYITEWQTVGGIGYCVAIRLNSLIKGQSMRVNSFDMQAEIGGPI